MSIKTNETCVRDGLVSQAVYGTQFAPHDEIQRGAPRLCTCDVMRPAFIRRNVARRSGTFDHVRCIGCGASLWLRRAERVEVYGSLTERLSAMVDAISDAHISVGREIIRLTSIQQSLWRRAIHGDQRRRIEAKRAFLSFLRSYAWHCAVAAGVTAPNLPV